VKRHFIKVLKTTINNGFVSKLRYKYNKMHYLSEVNEMTNLENSFGAPVLIYLTPGSKLKIKLLTGSEHLFHSCNDLKDKSLLKSISNFSLNQKAKGQKWIIQPDDLEKRDSNGRAYCRLSQKDSTLEWFQTAEQAMNNMKPDSILIEFLYLWQDKELTDTLLLDYHTFYEEALCRTLTYELNTYDSSNSIRNPYQTTIYSLHDFAERFGISSAFRKTK
jgi:hypothetical protein